MLNVEQLLEGQIILIDKPRQWSSFQAVNKVKSAIRALYGLKKFKIGHAGTLDPLATGLLLVCVGRATKEIERLQQGEKVYSGTMVLGATTPCHDLERPIDHYYPSSHLTLNYIEKAAERFKGEIEQVPPIFSAVKVDGQRAYRMARAESSDSNAEEPQIASKKVVVYDFDITGFRPGDSNFVAPDVQQEPLDHQTNLYREPLGVVPDGLPQIDFRIRCGKGTYIRSIARDLGMELGCGALLSSLRREQIGDYNVADAWKIDEVTERLNEM
ncbi:MAG: tRNA pseudouridine(55) synthase TruB [Bacteroidales bacterium]|nr:tRNA pseudouridine(55) synthase TruB [Bacteroidales bacterium]